MSSFAASVSPYVKGGPDPDDVEEWIRKTTALERTIRGIADGTYDADSIPSLKEFGILSEKEKAEDDDRRKKEKEAAEKRLMDSRKKEKDRERVKWWEGAVLFYGPKESDESGPVGGNAVVSADECENKGRTKILARYSSDYSRWSDTAYVPDDDATHEEQAEELKSKEKQESSRFEEANKEFCEKFKADIERREERQRQQKESAKTLRLQGNRLYKKREYYKALGKYMEALAIDPYDAPIVSNLALCHSKLGNWDDVMDFCDRAIHVCKGDDKGRSKALFQRATAMLALERAKDALSDLDKCLESDPSNHEAAEKRRMIMRDLEDDMMEERVRNATKSQCIKSDSFGKAGATKVLVHIRESHDLSSANGDGKYGLYQRLLALLVAEAKDDNFGIREICEFIDSAVKEINCSISCPRLSFLNTNGTSQLCHDASQIFNSTLDHNAALSPTEMLCTALHRWRAARAYLRTSGYLEQMCRAVVESGSSNKEGEDISSAGLCMRYRIIAEAICDETRSQDLMVEFGALSAAISTVSTTLADPDATLECAKLDSCISAFALFSAALESSNEAGSTNQRVASALRGHVRDVVCAVHRTIEHFSLNDDVEDGAKTTRKKCSAYDRGEGLVVCAKFVANLLACRSKHTGFSRCYRDRDFAKRVPLVHCFVRALTKCLDKSNPMCHTPISDLVSALVQLSTVEELRPTFRCSDATSNAVRVLLAVAKSHKIETYETREMALLAISNATVVASKADPRVGTEECGNGIIHELILCGGLKVLTNLVVSNPGAEGRTKSWAAIKSRASGLLSRCASYEECISALSRNADTARALLGEYERIVSDPNFSLSSLHLPPWYDAVAHGHIAVNLIRTLAALESARPNLLAGGSGGVVGAATSLLLSSLPRPRRGDCGRITAASVCQPPIPWEVGSARGVSAASASFYGNVLKLLIHSLDTDACMDRTEQGELLGRIICLLANSGGSSGQHPSATKNAMIVLAKLVQDCGKDDPDLLTRVRELRGMEILRELGKSQRIV